MVRLPVLVLLTPMLVPYPGAGQAIRGSILDQRERPVMDAVVVLTTSGREVDWSGTDPEGRFTVRAPTPGPYRLTVRLVGHEIAGDTLVDVTDQPPTDLTLSIVRRPLEFRDLPTGRAGACALAPLDGVAGLLMADARTALRLARWSEAGTADFAVRLFERRLAPDANHVFQQGDSLVRTHTPSAFVPAHSEHQYSGYVVEEAPDRIVYYAPDVTSLLDETFTSSHCFSVTRDRDGDRLGLHFSPRPGTTASDIEGTFWFAQEAPRLDRIEFRYTGNHTSVEHPRVGGELELGHPQPGTWVVRRWAIRMPRFSWDPADPERQPHLTSLIEVGGEVTGMRDAAGAPIFTDDRVAILQGTVFDSTEGQPLTSAAVSIAGTPYWATTDRFGEFAIAARLHGTYDLVLGQPRLDSMGFVATPRPVVLTPGEVTSVRITVPPLSTILATRCGDANFQNRRVLLGVVRDGRTGQPLPNAAVTVHRRLLPETLRQFASTNFGGTVVTDTLGLYALCGVPMGQSLTVSAAGVTGVSRFVDIRFAPDSVKFDDRWVYTGQRPVARLDLTVSSPAAWGTEITGTVTDRGTGQGLPGAIVQVDGTTIADTTDADGIFHLRGAPPGLVPIVIRRLGYRYLRQEVTIARRQHMAFSRHTFGLTAASVQTLDPITVKVKGVSEKLVGFEERRMTGLGSFVTREEFEKWSPNTPTDILRRLSGIRVLPNAYYGVGGDRRRYIIQPSRDIGSRITNFEYRLPTTVTTSFGDTPLLAVTECPVLIFLDGAFLGDTRETDVDNIMTTTNIAAVEVYSPSQVPAQFAAPGATCGVIVFWSR